MYDDISTAARLMVMVKIKKEKSLIETTNNTTNKKNNIVPKYGQFTVQTSSFQLLFNIFFFFFSAMSSSMVYNRGRDQREALLTNC